MYAACLMATLFTAQVPDTIVTGQTLHEVSVMAYRNPTRGCGAPSIYVSKEDIERQGYASLNEALQTLEGVSVRDYGGIGGLKTVSIRNFGAQHTGLSYDGLPILDCQNGQIDIGRFNLDAVDCIKVDIGGSDDIFRAARLSNYVGTVNIKGAGISSCNEPKGIHVDTKIRYGSFNTFNPYMRARIINNDWSFGVWGNYIGSDGSYPFTLQNGDLLTKEVRKNSQVAQFNGEVYSSGNLGRYGKLLLKGNGYHSTRGLPGSVIFYTQHPTEHLKEQTFTLAAIHEKQMESWRIRTSLSYNNVFNHYTDTLATKPTPDNDKYSQRQGAFSFVAMWDDILPNKHSTERRLALSLAEDIDIARLNSNLASSLVPTRESCYTSLSVRFTNKRLTIISTLLGLLSIEQVKTGQAAPTRRRVCPTLNLSWRILKNEDIHLRMAYKETYRLPTFNDLYYQRVGNHNLLPERARQCNIGATWQKIIDEHSMGITADAYYNNVRDKIVAIPTMFIWNMRNVGRVNMTGIDCSITYRGNYTSWMTLNVAANYSWQHAVDVTQHEAKNYRHQIAYTPRHSGNVVITAVMPWCNMSYILSAVGERYSLAQNTAAYRIPSYREHSISVNRLFSLPSYTRGNRSSHIRISIEAINLSNYNYEVIKYYPMPGRHYRFTFGFEL